MDTNIVRENQMHCVNLALLSFADFCVSLWCKEFGMDSCKSLCWEESDFLKPGFGVAEFDVAVLEDAEGFQAEKIDFAKKIIVALLHSASHF